MGKNKSHELKKKLGKALQQNRRVPLFAMAKTARRVTRNVKSRHWKNKKLKIKVD
ncbi:50S ribosomal protein L39e [Candidatus Micrarchaeota archaeon]|nr:50S ribosomal protein L39e [Candidatus Micrarchaeota archaeon]